MFKSLLHALTLGGSVLLLAACAVLPSNPSHSIHEKTITTTTAAPYTRPPKSIEDGSRPFTMPEIQDRLLRVLALPPEQINKENVEKIFGVVLKGERNTFYEEISDDRKVGFVIEAPPSTPLGIRLEYSTLVKKIEVDGKERMSELPIDIPADYKLSYPDFVRQLQNTGWASTGGDYSHGVLVNYLEKDNFLLLIYIDQYQARESQPLDYSETRLSRIVVKKANN